MPQRNVATHFTFEQQRQEINLLASDFWTQKTTVDTAADTYLKADGSVSTTAALTLGGNLVVPNAFTINPDSGNGTVTISGNLDVTGTTTTVSSANLEVTDKNILISKGSTTDAQADGAGITIDSDTDITWNFVDAKDAWVSSIGIEATTTLKVNGNSTCIGNLNIDSDTSKLQLGTTQDLQIFHNNNLSTIKNTHVNGVAVRSDVIMLQNAAGDHDYLATANELGVTLFYDNSPKLATTNTGAVLTGTDFGFGAVPGGDPAAKNVFLAIGDSDTGIVQDGDGQLELWANNTEVANINAIDGYTSTKPITTTGAVQTGALKSTGLLTVENDLPKIKLIDSDATGTPEAMIDGSGGDLFLEVDKDDEKGSSLFGIKIDGSEKFRITSDGEIRIDGPTAATHGIRFTPNGWNGYQNRIGLCGTSGADSWWSSNWNPTDGSRDSANYATNFIRQNVSSGYLSLGTGGVDQTATERLRITSDKVMTSVDFKPDAHHTRDIGTAANAFRDIYGQTITVSTAYDSKGNIRSVPATEPGNANYELVATDAGKYVDSQGAGREITVPSGTFSKGDVVTIVRATSGDVTIKQGNGLTMYHSADGANTTTGDRVLSQRGMVTMIFVNPNYCYISGTGLS